MYSAIICIIALYFIGRGLFCMFDWWVCRKGERTVLARIEELERRGYRDPLDGQGASSAASVPVQLRRQVV